MANMDKRAMANERTFGIQDKLPSLPVPSLRNTLDKYLDSVRVHLLPEEYERTKRVVAEFERGAGAQLHELLLQRAKRERNWLEKWWEKYAYHIPRYPILPLVNFGGANPNYELWPHCDGSAIERCALTIYWSLRYWDLVRREQVPVQRQRDTPWCMNQLHRLFNTCRIPGEREDQLKFSFKSVNGGHCPSNIVVMLGGLFWSVDILNPETGDIFTAPQLQACFEEIHKRSASLKAGVPIGALTCLERTDWFKERQHLIALSVDNGRHLNLIEESIFIVSFTEERPTNDNQLSFQAMCPKPYFSWADKNVVWQFHKNGMISTNCDHSYLDAIMVLQMNTYVDVRLKENGYQWKGNTSKRPYPPPSQLTFVTDSRTVAAVDRALETWQPYANDMDMLVWHASIGINFFKNWRLYADTAVQLAFQLAYLRLHHKPAATYETSTTRKYYHGRTETVRSCTPEAVEWARSMLSPSEGVASQRRKFDTAVQKHNRLMLEAMNGEGCDRHLFGLRILAEENGLPTPDIYKDPAWKKSGGDGNFIISSSFLGYNSQWGGVAPMCTDGYGIFYRMLPDSITFYVSAWKSSKETNLALWRDSLEYALMEIKKLVEHSSNLTAKF